ncbi:MAG: twin-arginine translocation signal domain-containing protein [Candidatus Aminicenantes bacterium]|nr:twin-arginine translocation signal domain-containing protein [Candidatus Aminicenantes bacterium]
MAGIKWTRRDFLKAAAVAPVASAVGCSCLTCPKAVPAPPPGAGTARITQVSRNSRVVLVRDAAAVGEGRKIDAMIVRKMLDEAVNTLFGENDPVAAWKQIVGPDDIVGVKTSEWPSLPTGPELEGAIRERLIDAGVPAGKISIADRGVLGDPVFQAATVLINVRPARIDDRAGIGGCLENYIAFVPDPAAWSADAWAGLAGIWSLPEVKGRTRLNILSMLTPPYDGGGPDGSSEPSLWPYKGLIISRDPVAADAIGLSIIQAKRREVFGEDRPLKASAHYLELADTKHGLGKSKPEDIDLIRLGWTEGILI